MSFFKSLQNIADKIGKAVNEVTSSPDVSALKGNPHNYSQPPSYGPNQSYSQPPVPPNTNTSGGKHSLDKENFGIYDARIEFDGRHYSVYHTEKKRNLPFIYDDAVAFSRYHIVLTVVQPDGSKRYAIATTRMRLLITEADYKDVDFYDDGMLLITDEEDDKYVIDNSGEIRRKAVYDKELKEELKRAAERSKKSGDDSDGSDLFDFGLDFDEDVFDEDVEEDDD